MSEPSFSVLKVPFEVDQAVNPDLRTTFPRLSMIDEQMQATDASLSVIIHVGTDYRRFINISSLLLIGTDNSVPIDSMIAPSSKQNSHR